MTNRRDESTEARVAAVLRGDPGAADRLLRFLTVHALDPGPLLQRAEAELAATHDDLEDYRLELYDTLTTDRSGKSALAYRRVAFELPGHLAAAPLLVSACGLPRCRRLLARPPGQRVPRRGR